MGAAGVFVAENKKGNQMIPLIFVTPTGFKPVTF